MFFSKRHSGVSNYALASTAASAVLSQLRQAYPLSIEVPHFGFGAQAGTATRDWRGELPRSVTRQALIAAGLAAIVLALATTLPAWAVFHGGSSTASRTELRSSVGTTSTTSMRVSDLSAGTFAGHIPFVEHIRYFDGLTSSSPAAASFIQGARQASIVSYLQNVGSNMALPYLNNAVTNKQQIDTWIANIQAAQRQAQDAATRKAAAQAATQAAASRVWEPAPAVNSGTSDGTQLSSTVTFYACVGNGFCGNMSSGQRVFPGAAACSSNLPLGTRFVVNADPNHRVFTCLDRGALSATWVDIWFYDSSEGWAWQSNVGTSSEITILQ
jgi:hypothetical protein